jgi:hypothetical protein
MALSLLTNRQEIISILHVLKISNFVSVTTAKEIKILVLILPLVLSSAEFNHFEADGHVNEFLEYLEKLKEKKIT